LIKNNQAIPVQGRQQQQLFQMARYKPPVYKIKLLEIFEIQREGEQERFVPYKNFHRQLLLHGSRVSNYAGILSQGLRIAPPEAPVTGYLFGKGLYFADAVAKSAHYCFATKENNEAFLLLSEVAVGNMHMVNKFEPFVQPLCRFSQCEGIW